MKGNDTVKKNKRTKKRVRLFPHIIDQIHGVKIRRETLQFSDKEIEKQYEETNAHQTLRHLRQALLFGVFIFLLLGVLDYYLFPGEYLRMWAIRLTSLTPFALFLVLLSYTKEWRIIQPAAAFAMLIAGTANIAMVTEYVSRLGSVYYIGMIIFLLYGYTVLRVRFMWMVRAGLGMILFYELIALFITQVPSDIFLINNVFLIAANVVGMFASYTIERFSRKDFVQNMLLAKSADSLALSLGVRERHLKHFIHDAKEVVLFQLLVTGDEMEIEDVSASVDEFLEIQTKDRKNLSSWFSGDLQIVQKILQAVKAGESFDHEFSYTTPKSYSKRSFRMVILSSPGDRGEVRGLGILLDTTEERLLAAKQAELLEQKSRFINVLAHQLNTPLNVVKWGVETILSRSPGSLTQKQAVLLGGIQEAGERMIGVLQDILSVLVLIDKKNVPMHREEMSVADIVVPVVGRLDHRLQKRDFTFVPNAMEEYLVEGDRDRLQIIVQKVLENALDYSQDTDKLRLIISKENAQVLISVENEGVLIPEEERSQLFEIFFRGKDAVRMQPNRTGVGLSMARFYSRLHGGDVRFYEGDNKTNIFTITWPLV